MFTWNPSLPGVKSEDTILVNDSGFEVLTKTGEWIYITFEFEGKIIQRPDILIRK